MYSTGIEIIKASFTMAWIFIYIFNEQIMIIEYQWTPFLSLQLVLVITLIFPFFLLRRAP